MTIKPVSPSIRGPVLHLPPHEKKVGGSCQGPRCVIRAASFHHPFHILSPPANTSSRQWLCEANLHSCGECLVVLSLLSFCHSPNSQTWSSFTEQPNLPLVVMFCLAISRAALFFLHFNTKRNTEWPGGGGDSQVIRAVMGFLTHTNINLVRVLSLLLIGHQESP